MAIQVSNLTIKPQTGNPGTYYASWTFNGTTQITSSGVKVGDLVSIKSGATYYNGVSIPSWVMNQKWHVTQIKGDRAVLGKNASGSNNINSPINIKYLAGGTTTTTTSTKDLDYYEVTWHYNSGDGWFVGNGPSNVKEKNATYSPPDYATKFKVTVKPVAKKTTNSNGKETSPWDGSAVSFEYKLSEAPPAGPPPNPTVEIDGLALTAKVENVSDARTDEVVFEIYNGTLRMATVPAKVIACQATMTYTVVPGGEYRVRCRAVAVNGSSKAYSEWTSFTSADCSIPATPTGLKQPKSLSRTSVWLEWNAAKAAEKYEIEYTTKLRYFDTSDQTQKVSGEIKDPHWEVTGLEPGQEYFFRVRAVNKESDYSGWSNVVSIVIGVKPTMPTTWSSTTTAIVGEPVNLYWVHNAADGSDWRYSQLEIFVDGVKSISEDIKNNNVDSEDEENPTIKYVLDTSKLVEGAKITWHVRTAGITLEYGEWSIDREIDVYALTELALDVTDVGGNSIDVLTAFPLCIYALPSKSKQTPIGYHLEITSDEIYETTDNIGNVKMVNVGDSVYSKYFDITDSLGVILTPANVNLDNDISYTVSCTVSMDSGLTATATRQFSVKWTDDIYHPNAEIAIDTDTLSAYIRPYCEELIVDYYKVTKDDTTYTKTNELIETIIDGEWVSGAVTSTGEDVYTGTTADGTTVYYCEIETRNLVDGITLSIYRREFDGTFTELATGLKNTEYTFVTDPHPALDYARYRVVAVTDSTGAISFYDIPGQPTGITDIVIQWDEAWTNFNAGNGDELEQPPWSGSLLRLPYDIDVSETSKPDVSFVNYIGRSHPVTYYGTQVGQTATWNTNVPYNDEETIYALRRLQRWMGDVYVREPSGSGYWANVTVQFSQKHCDVYVPVSLSLTRVEGGI